MASPSRAPVPATEGVAPLVEAVAIRSPRQRELIAVAARLFAERGYHAVGINEISGELGLTGPAFYRHYRSKEDLLIAVLTDVITSHLNEVRALVAQIDDPEVALTRIIDHHVAFVFNQAQNITTWRTEFRSIPDQERHHLRYLQRLYTEEWVRTVQALRPDLKPERARAMCQAAIALIQSPTEFQTRLSRGELSTMLAGMARQVLMDSKAPVRRLASR